MTVRGYLMSTPADPQAALTSNTYRWATVTDASPLEIQFDGDSLPLATIPDCLCDPLTLAVGDRVWTQVYGRKVIVHGAAGGGTGPHTLPNEVAVSLAPAGTCSTNSGAYVDWPNANGGPLTATIVKRAAGTAVVAEVAWSGYSTLASHWVDAGFKIDGAAAVQVDHAYFNPALTHMHWSGHRKFTGLAAGSRVFIMQIKTDGGQHECDANDWFSMTLREVAP